ncbi:MAG TPA: hypothetical protein VGE29_15630 [Prosthecobacter sp.]
MIKLLGLGILCGLSAASAAEEGVRTLVFSGPAGRYSLQQWKKDWPGCEFEGGIADGRVERVAHDSTAGLRVHFAPGQIGPEKGGAGWRWPFGQQEGAELKYTVRFSPGFEFVKGGKLPGLCGGPENVSGGRKADGSNGFSARLMWRRDGRGEAYVYHKNQPENYGHSFPFPDDFRFPLDQPVGVRLAVTMNAPGQTDGTLRVWITLPPLPEKLVVEKKNMEWRSKASFGVDSLYFEAFHGGGDTSWAPKKECWAEFSEVSVRPVDAK